MKILPYTCILFVFAVSCHDNPQPSSGKAATGQADTAAGNRNAAPKNFFPVADYLLGEIRNVDSTPVAIRKYDIRDSKIDSGFIQGAAFHRLAGQFLPAELELARLEKDYTESAFQDETTGYLTFTYSPKDKALSLQRVDVLTIPGRTANQVKSIYLEKVEKSGDTTLICKMYWKAGQDFLIVTNSQLPGGKALVSQVKVVWGTPPQDN